MQSNGFNWKRVLVMWAFFMVIWAVVMMPLFTDQGSYSPPPSNDVTWSVQGDPGMPLQSDKLPVTDELDCLPPDHVFVKGTAIIWCEAPAHSSKPKVNFFGHHYAWITGWHKVKRTYDGLKCPLKNVTCYKATFRGHKPSPENQDMKLVIHVKVGHKVYRSRGQYSVYKDDFNDVPDETDPNDPFVVPFDDPYYEPDTSESPQANLES